MKKLFIAAVLLFSITNLIQAQEKDATAIQQLLESRNYIFKARTVSPQRGQLRYLTPDYDLTIRKDTVIAWLPFFGRSNSAGYNNTSGGIKFTSTNFEYTSKKGKRKRWEITIRPGDVSDVQYLYLTVYDNSEALLQVISTNRETISFNGDIIEGLPLAKKGF